jgi:hypothetical protein
VEADDGSHSLPVTVPTPGEQTLTVTDMANDAIVGKVKVNMAP